MARSVYESPMYGVKVKITGSRSFLSCGWYTVAFKCTPSRNGICTPQVISTPGVVGFGGSCAGNTSTQTLSRMEQATTHTALFAKRNIRLAPGLRLRANDSSSRRTSLVFQSCEVLGLTAVRKN